MLGLVGNEGVFSISCLFRNCVDGIQWTLHQENLGEVMEELWALRALWEDNGVYEGLLYIKVPIRA